MLAVSSDLRASVPTDLVQQLPTLAPARLAHVKLVIFSGVLSLTPAEEQAAKQLYSGNRTVV